MHPRKQTQLIPPKRNLISSASDSVHNARVELSPTLNLMILHQRNDSRSILSARRVSPLTGFQQLQLKIQSLSALRAYNSINHPYLLLLLPFVVAVATESLLLSLLCVGERKKITLVARKRKAALRDGA